MATGSNKEGRLEKPLDQQGGGQSAGVPAEGEVEGNAYSPLGNPGVQHWQATFISQDGLQDRGNIFFAAVEMTRMPMTVTDPRQPDNPIVFANGAFFDLTGYNNDEVIGRNCRFLQGPQTDPRTVDEVRKAVSEERAVAVDILNYKKDGKAFWNALFIGPIFDKDGKLLYFFASQMDITERRTTQEAYLQAQKMEAIGQLTAGMAHDFNNLLQVINGNLEVALVTLERPDMARQQLERAQRAAMRAGKLTQQLLTFARKQRLEPKPVNINNLVVDFSEMLVRTLGGKIELRLDLRPGLPVCMLDQTHLEMALLNVLINARDAMPAGGEVTVATSIVRGEDRLKAHGLPPGTYISLCVIDQGQGMSPDVLRRATEPFFTTKGPGTGLGLAMVHGFVQQSQGRLEIASHPGEGTKVTMIFPVADNGAGHGDAAAGAGNAPSADQARANANKPCVLVVEDNDDVRELAEQVLEMEGYAVQSAASGEQAMELLRQDGTVDLLFTDVIMPGGMNGLDLVKQARALRPGLPVLVTTGYMDELPRGGRSGGLEILPKPYRQENLLERVRKALEGNR
ncbi:histidine kinase [Massilia sp. WF1]|uniref:histidine kinase famiy protein n=1 Tax=unclassified Massilia TaxID=2609279 RepID=UPI000649BD56|nr:MULTISPECIES: histidine kinase famiy protein [unclassified Massilia]ALK98778.1 hybrid sensor histidine kinase/response regulator [Massilia sp. WG5]KLU38675.1 histidine kinase [Massilia sp. WF1]